MRAVLLVATAFAWSLLLGGAALAHGTQYRVLGSSETLVEFAYTDGEAMAFASYQLFGPADAQVPVRSGRTDRQGRVGFVPDASGQWRIEVRDAEGHVVRAVLNSAAGKVAAGQGLPAWLGALSLSLNAVGAALLVQVLLDRRQRRRRAQPA
jgi:hypothetical protein